jgi:hypothetical protein
MIRNQASLRHSSYSRYRNCQQQEPRVQEQLAILKGVSLKTLHHPLQQSSSENLINLLGRSNKKGNFDRFDHSKDVGHAWLAFQSRIGLMGAIAP